MKQEGGGVKTESRVKEIKGAGEGRDKRLD